MSLIKIKKFCYIWNKRIKTNNGNKEYHKVRDHCHFAGKYIGPAHNISNLRYKEPKKILIVFDNGSN